MGERFWVKFYVGGECSEEDRERLMEAIDAEAPENTPEWGEHLSAEFPEVNYAELYDLETFCRECGLSWDKVIESKAGYDSVIWWWRPGMEEARHCPAHDGQPTVCVSDLEDMLDSQPSVEDIKEWLETMTPPALPPFTITGEPSNDPETNPAA